MHHKLCLEDIHTNKQTQFCRHKKHLKWGYGIMKRVSLIIQCSMLENQGDVMPYRDTYRPSEVDLAHRASRCPNPFQPRSCQHGGGHHGRRLKVSVRFIMFSQQMPHKHRIFRYENQLARQAYFQAILQHSELQRSLNN